MTKHYNKLQSDTKLLWSFIYWLVKGLEYIHNIGFAHCDITPQNFLITPSGVVKYIDLGLACVNDCKWNDCKNICIGRLGNILLMCNKPNSITSNPQLLK